MKYIAALMIISIFLAACASQPRQANINWDNIVYGTSGIELPPQQQYEHATK